MLCVWCLRMRSRIPRRDGGCPRVAVGDRGWDLAGACVERRGEIDGRSWAAGLRPTSEVSGRGG